MGPLQREDRVTPHTRPPADDDADHMLVRIIECLEGRVEVDLVCEPAFDYGRTPAEWTHHRRAAATLPTRSAPAVRCGWCRTSRWAWRPGACAAGTRCRRASGAFCALSWAEDLEAPDDVDAAERADRRDPAVLAQLARSRADPGPSLARSDAALGPGHQGPDVHADRRDGRRAHHLAAGDARRRAQLGLPLHVDARHDVHAAGAALAEPRLGSRRVHAVRRRPRAESRTAACRSCTASTAVAT